MLKSNKVRIQLRLLMLLAVIAIVFPATIIGSEPLSHSGDEDEGWNIAYIVDDRAV